MFGLCKACNKDVGYFKLVDGVCGPCLVKTKRNTGKFNRLINSMPILTWLFPLFILFQLASPWISQRIVSGSPEVANVTKAPDFVTQLAFSVALLIILSIPLIFSFAIRFYIVRRCLHSVLAWTALILLFVLPVGALSLFGGGSQPVPITIIFLFVAFKIMRLDNILENDMEKASQ